MSYNGQLLFVRQNVHGVTRGVASPEKLAWKTDRTDDQQVCLTICMSFLLRNEYRPEESGVDISTPFYPVASPLRVTEKCPLGKEFVYQRMILTKPKIWFPSLLNEEQQDNNAYCSYS